MHDFDLNGFSFRSFVAVRADVSNPQFPELCAGGISEENVQAQHRSHPIALQ
jgi:hypothetical protein